MIQDFNLWNTKLVAATFPKGIGLSTYEGEMLENPEIYRQLVGRQLYLNNTMPDLSYATQHLSQFLIYPRKSHLQAAMNVVR